MNTFLQQFKSIPFLLLLLLLFVNSPKAFMQTNSSVQMIKGKVTDASGEAIIGASIVIKGMAGGTISDINGNYQLQLPQGANTVLVSYIGMKQQELAVGDKELVNVLMEENSVMLSEVVAIGYGESKRKDLTGSVSSIGAESLSKLGIPDLTGNLQGRLAGVKVNAQSGEAGGSVDIKIRGANSIYAGSSPLYVIDGMQIDVNESEVATSTTGGSTTYNPLSTLNPNDIATIDILKDASSTAIYGARGANGVIIITTKSGSAKNKTDISFNTSYGVSQVAKRIKVLNAQDYINYKYTRDYVSGNLSSGYGMDSNADGKIDAPKDANAYQQFNWQDALLRQGSSHNYDLAVNSTLEKTRISSSLGYLTQEGLVVGNSFDRYSAKIKIDHPVNDKLSVGSSVILGSTVSKGVVSSGGGDGGFTGLIQAIYTERPVVLYTASELLNDYPNGYVKLDNMVSDAAFRQSTLNRMIGSVNAEYKILKELKFTLSGSANLSTSKLQEFYGATTTWGRLTNGTANISEVGTNSSTASATLFYNKTFKKDHTFTALLGSEMSAYHLESFGVKAKGFEDQSTGVFDISKGAVVDKPTSLVTQVNRMSAFGRISYTYMSKYYLTANIRADESSNFQVGNRLGYFPSVSTAWRVNSEKFMKSLDFISNLKIRASAGSSGNDRITPYGSMGALTPSYYSSNGATIMGMTPYILENKNLKWETTNQYDLGLDLSLFNNRISLTGDVYFKDTRDMLFKAKIPVQSGYTDQWQNIGRMSNKGIELSLITRNIETKDFTWTTTTNFDLNRNEVLSLGDAQFLPVTIGAGLLTDVSRVIVGQPIGTGYGYIFDGNYQLSDFTWIDKTTQLVVDPSTITSANMSQHTSTRNAEVVKISGLNVNAGDRKYKDISGPNGVADGVIDNYDRTFISNSNPKFNFGFGNEFTYKSFDLNIFFEGVVGPQIMNAFNSMVEAGGKGSNSYNITQEFWNNRWTPENPSNTYASLLNASNNFVSSYYVEDASYVRLKNITLGYKPKAKSLKAIGISSFRCYLSVENAYLWTKYSGMDPDIRSANPLFAGFDRLSYPRAQSLTMGVNLTF